MDFHHSEDRQMLADSLGRFIADRYPIEVRNKAAYGDLGYDPAAWAGFAELGIVSALFDEAAGGFGGSGFDIMVVFEALGRGLATEPFLGALMAGTALARAGGRDEALGRIVSGEAIAAFAHDEASGDRIDARAIEAGEGWTLSGAKAVVRHAEAAALLVISAMAEGALALFLVEKGAAGLAIRGYGTVEGGRAGEVTLANTPAVMIGAAGQGDALVAAAIDAGLLALSAEALGAMEVMRGATLDYLRTRMQFGVPIGKFQALQHRMATVLLEIEQMRSAVINAASAYDGEDPRARARALAAAKQTAGHTGTLVAEEAIQLHGGIAMTWELPLSHYAKRLTMIDHQLGDEDYHLARFAALAREKAA